MVDAPVKSLKSMRYLFITAIKGQKLLKKHETNGVTQFLISPTNTAPLIREFFRRKRKVDRTDRDRSCYYRRTPIRAY